MRMILIAFIVSAAFCQDLEFEVASVKLTTSPPVEIHSPGLDLALEALGGISSGRQTPGRIHYSGVGLKVLIVKAYEMRTYQISCPRWMETERYDIDATYPARTTPDEVRQMLKRLLAVRFHLQLHRETKELQLAIHDCIRYIKVN